MMIPLQFAGVGVGQRTMILAVVLSLFVYLVLVWTDNFDWPIYFVFVIMVTVLASNSMGYNVFGILFTSPIWPLVVFGALFLGWRAIKAYRESNKSVVKVASDKVR